MSDGTAEEQHVTDRNSRLTGVLLVGGASERFGSPKALARFRGANEWTVALDRFFVAGRGARRGLSLEAAPVLDDIGAIAVHFEPRQRIVQRRAMEEAALRAR